MGGVIKLRGKHFLVLSEKSARESAKEHALMIKALEKKNLKKLFELGEKHLEKMILPKSFIKSSLLE